jgi:hypothetical protein
MVRSHSVTSASATFAHDVGIMIRKSKTNANYAAFIHVRLSLIHTGWVHAHNCLRKEMKEMIAALKATGQRGVVKDWEVTCIKSAWEAHWENIHSHHTNEDNIMVPFLKTRFHYPDKVSTSSIREVPYFSLGMFRLVLTYVCIFPIFLYNTGCRITSYTTHYPIPLHAYSHLNLSVHLSMLLITSNWKLPWTS